MSHWKRASAGVSIGALAAVGVAIVVGPLRRRLRETLPFLCLRGSETGEESAQLRALLTAARGAGCTEPDDAAAVRTILTLFIEHLPIAERNDLLVHLASDVRQLAVPPHRSGIAIGMLPNTIDAQVDAVSEVITASRETAHEVVVNVLQTLRAVLPEECRDIQRRLPNELADLWTVSPLPLTSKPGHTDQ